jgi:hypothetical protein
VEHHSGTASNVKVEPKCLRIDKQALRW